MYIDFTSKQYLFILHALAMIDDAPEKHKSKGWTNAMPKNKRS